jgi:hypothetical protein
MFSTAEHCRKETGWIDSLAANAQERVGYAKVAMACWAHLRRCDEAREIAARLVREGAVADARADEELRRLWDACEP